MIIQRLKLLSYTQTNERKTKLTCLAFGVTIRSITLLKPLRHFYILTYVHTLYIHTEI